MTDKDLYTQLAEAIGAHGSKHVPKIAEKLADENEIKIIMAASPPKAVEEISEETGFNPDKVQKMLDALFQKGLIYKSKKPDATRYYRVRNIVQFHDATILTPGQSKEILDMWKAFDEEEWPSFLDMIEQFIPKAGSRVIPVNISIEPESKILAFEDVRQIVKNSDRIAVLPCTCRMLHGECGKPVDVCLQLDRAADYNLERGIGREVTKEEAMDILKLAEEAGLVHTTDNKRSKGNLICNCCEDCCINWPGTRKASKKFVAPSRFLAEVDQDLCTGCETCLDRCHFDAIAMEGNGGIAVIDPENCMGCGLCLVTCPVDALSLKEERTEDFVDD